MLADEGLTRLMWVVLCGLGEDGIEITSGLADGIGITRASTSRLLTTMEGRGLIRRGGASGPDRRQVALELRDRGQAILTPYRPEADAITAHFMAKLGTDQARILMDSLAILAQGEGDGLTRLCGMGNLFSYRDPARASVALSARGAAAGRGRARPVRADLRRGRWAPTIPTRVACDAPRQGDVRHGAHGPVMHGAAEIPTDPAARAEHLKAAGHVFDAALWARRGSPRTTGWPRRSATPTSMASAPNWNRVICAFPCKGGVIAEQVRRLGYATQVHSVLDGDVLQPPFLLLSCLGEGSGIGEVILNPFLDPRLKSGMVTTDMPMAHDLPLEPRGAAGRRTRPPPP